MKNWNFPFWKYKTWDRLIYKELGYDEFLETFSEIYFQVSQSVSQKRDMIIEYVPFLRVQGRGKFKGKDPQVKLYDKRKT